MKTRKTLAVLAAAWLASSAALAADTLPAGTLITGSASGAATTLLGLDHSFADEPGTNTTALAAADLEFLTGDFAVAVDFGADGSVQFWNNTGAAALPGSYSMTFSFAGLTQPLSGFSVLDASGVAAGSVTTQLLTDHSVAITFNNLNFTTDFGSFTAQISVSAVPEPSSYALLGAGLALVAVARRRSHHTGRQA